MSDVCTYDTRVDTPFLAGERWLMLPRDGPERSWEVAAVAFDNKGGTVLYSQMELH